LGLALGAYLHDGAAILFRSRNALFILKGDAPNRPTLRNEFTDRLSSLEIPDLEAAVTTTAYDARVVELQARHAVVVGSETVDGVVPFERPYPNRPVTTAGNKSTTTHLQLSHKGRMALKDG
jgi:hypothetical protein